MDVDDSSEIDFMLSMHLTLSIISWPSVSKRKVQINKNQWLQKSQEIHKEKLMCRMNWLN